MMASSSAIFWCAVRRSAEGEGEPQVGQLGDMVRVAVAVMFVRFAFGIFFVKVCEMVVKRTHASTRELWSRASSVSSGFYRGETEAAFDADMQVGWTLGWTAAELRQGWCGSARLCDG